MNVFKKITGGLFMLLPILCLFIAAGLFAPAAASGANTFSVTLPASTEITMQDADAVLPVTITNDSATKSIRDITFTIDTVKYSFSSATVAPSGWCIDSVATGSITFALTQAGGACSNGNTASKILPGASLLFDLTLEPVAVALDVTAETLTGVTVTKENGFSLLGALPTWTLRSLETTMTSLAESVGVGGEITVTLYLTNRTTSTLTALEATPGPPTASSAIVTNTDGPFYGTTLTRGNTTAAATSISVDSTADFSSSGTIKIDSEEICYSSITATSFGAITRGCNSTVAASHSNNSVVYNLTPFTLAADESGTISWTFSADSTGEVYFTTVAANGAATAKSEQVTSNRTVIGDFTAILTVSPEAVITAQTATATLVVQNNGSTTLYNVAPTLPTGCVGGATESYVSGPVPATIASLVAGSTGAFEWTYAITGAEGDAYCLIGTATADGPVVTNTATSNTGTISHYSVTLTPAIISSGATNQTLLWNIYNGSGCSIRSVDITPPVGAGTWTCGSVTAPASWSGACGAPVAYSSGGAGTDIASGGSGQFGITFTTTETVTSDTVLSFPVDISARGCGGTTSTLGSYVTLSQFAISLAHTPVGPIDADGTAAYTMTATLTKNGAALSGKTIDFTTTNGVLSATTGITDETGVVTLTLTAPTSTTDTSADVTVTYLSISATDTLSFTGWNKANLQYWGSLTPTPASVDCGVSVYFTLDIRNIHPTFSMNLDTLSYFAFNDSAAGGGATYIAYLNAPVTIPANSTVTGVQFGPVAVDSAFLAGTYTPTSNSAPPPESGLFFSDGGTNDQYRGVSDTVTVGGSCGASTIDIIEWHEMR
ncbi:MAG: Ig-like domain-containing protein [Proteobacteria bacterium]|nr:Ig-like domain-containing protein [Pseudomonadota bacterium]